MFAHTILLFEVDIPWPPFLESEILPEFGEKKLTVQTPQISKEQEPDLNMSPWAVGLPLASPCHSGVSRWSPCTSGSGHRALPGAGQPLLQEWPGGSSALLPHACDARQLQRTARKDIVSSEGAGAAGTAGTAGTAATTLPRLRRAPGRPASGARARTYGRSRVYVLNPPLQRWKSLTACHLSLCQS